MTNNSSQKNFVATGLALTILIAAFGAMPFLVGCCHVCDRSAHSPASPEGPEKAKVAPDPVIVAAAQQQLDVAKKRGVWNEADQRSFSAEVGQLPRKEHLNLSRQLAVLITSGKLRVDPGPASELPPTCPCVPGLCPAADQKAARPAIPGSPNIPTQAR